MTIKVYQGERGVASATRVLGEFNLEGIPPAPRGMPQIEVTFDIDSNGIVHVSAKDQGTGKEQKIRIESSSGLSDEQSDEMVNDAKDHEEEDRERKEAATTRNQAESLVYSTERSLTEYKDKIDDADRDAIQAEIDAVKKALESDSIDEIKEKMESLNTASHKISEVLYKQATDEEGQAQADLPKAEDPGHRSSVVGCQRRVLHHAVHRLLDAVPVDVKTVEVERGSLDLASGPEEQRLVHVERLAQKRQEADQREKSEQEVRARASRKPAFLIDSGH